MDPRKVRKGAFLGTDPRIRGDGPNPVRHTADRADRPPHTRGWTRWPPKPSWRPKQTPAYAGMDPGPRLLPIRSSTDPRIRGDGPSSVIHAVSAPTRPPHTRGWTSVRRATRRKKVQTPAYAGMDRILSSYKNIRLTDPRIRGDGPDPRGHTRRGADRPPHTRGWTPRRRPLKAKTAQTPAYAGMDLHCLGYVPVRRPDPRIRGDGPWYFLLRARIFSRPPHTRGWTQRPYIHESTVLQTPAYAGMDPLQPGDHCQFCTDPRIRGDGPKPLYAAGIWTVRPPHTRGWTSAAPAAYPRCGQTPAYAGMDPGRNARSNGGTADPRIRGDGPK